jgi:hypothetical protein
MPSSEIRFVHTLKLCKVFFSSNFMLYIPPTQSSTILSLKYGIYWIVKVTKNLLHIFVHPPFTVSLLAPNTVSTPSSQTPLMYVGYVPPCARSELTSASVHSKQAFSSTWSYKLILTFRPRSLHIRWRDEKYKVKLLNTP